jgi:hypothetical protein
MILPISGFPDESQKVKSGCAGRKASVLFGMPMLCVSSRRAKFYPYDFQRACFI